MTAPRSEPQPEILRRRPGVLEARVSAEELVLLGPDSGAYLGLNAVAADIWAKLAEPCGLVDLVAALAEEYDAPPARIEADIAPFLAELLADGVIETRPPGAQDPGPEGD